MSCRLSTTIALAALCWSAAGALSQPVPPGQEGPLAELAPPIHGRKACFRRVYDSEHLARHPHQRVQALSLGINYHRHEPHKFYPEGQRNYYFTLRARVKGEPRTLVGSGECTTGDGRIGCGIDCDGGGFGLALKEDGSLLLDLTPYGRLRMTRSCGGEEEDTVDLTPGRDDKLFRLERTAESACEYSE